MARAGHRAISAFGDLNMSDFQQMIVFLVRFALFAVLVMAGLCAAPGFAATKLRSMDAEALTAAIRSMIGPSVLLGRCRRRR
jgi:hypothetical protein